MAPDVCELMLSQLIYASDAVGDVPSGTEPDFLPKARMHNQDARLSGVLVFTDRHFLQCLEGSRENVTGTFRRIANDPRHSNVVLIGVSDIKDRFFSDWSMGFLRMDALDRATFRLLIPSGQFLPGAMSPELAVTTLLALRDTGFTI